MPAIVMVVDDDANTRRLLQFILSNAGYDVVEATDGLDALEKLETMRADLIILDVLMPNLDGLTTMQQMRMTPHLADLPVIFLSSRADVAAEYAGLAAGARQYLVKPFSVPALLQHVSDLLVTPTG